MLCYFLVALFLSTFNLTLLVMTLLLDTIPSDFAYDIVLDIISSDYACDITLDTIKSAFALDTM